MDGLQWKTLLKWMIWWEKPTIFGNIHMFWYLQIYLKQNSKKSPF